MDKATAPSGDVAQFDAFITRWRESGAAERANYQLFLSQLCDLLDVPQPEPATPNDHENAYVFERRVVFDNGDGTASRCFIDLYKRGCFVLEAKQGADATQEAAALSRAEQQRRGLRHRGSATRDTAGWETAMMRAKGQAESYARALPGDEGRPPFVVVVDVGYCIELFSEFTRTGGNYVPFPDPRTYRISLDDIRRDDIRERLRLLWLDPMALDPSRRTARVTREIADRLARLAKSLEASGHRPKGVAGFLMRCLFTMFAEDIGLLPEGAFIGLLNGLRKKPKDFKTAIEDLWRVMNTGGFYSGFMTSLLRFNGGLFAEPHALDLNVDQLDLLIEAAHADWREVEPAIFGTLLERALDPDERHKLGAHYTPRAYVERLVLPTIVEPLREEWAAVQAAVALSLARADAMRSEATGMRERAKHGDTAAKLSTKAHELETNADKLGKEAEAELVRFHQRLCKIRILDPACGSGNFLYVSLEHLKRLEGEVLGFLRTVSKGAFDFLESEGVTVDPHQLLGLEINPRAAAITELVLWIGYLQWHYRTHGDVTPPEPVIKNFKNIECRDAVLAYDKERIVIDPETNKPVTRWDGKTYKKHPVTGEDVPDESARANVLEYINPRPAEWPDADFVVGNPPFIGTALMRQALGDGYTETIRKTIPEVPESSDYVMYWWNHAAHLAREHKIRRFGFIATNSLRQTFNRRVLEYHMRDPKKPLSLLFAIPDHPWVDSADGAAVRISMTVATAGQHTGTQKRTICEESGDEDSILVDFAVCDGSIHPDLSIGADIASVAILRANCGISSRGLMLFGAGFLLDPDQARQLEDADSACKRHFRRYINGRDLNQKSRAFLVIDLWGLSEEETRTQVPLLWQWLHDRVKPERDANRDRWIREHWWLHGRPRPEWRCAASGLSRYIATVETSKHRFFVFLDESIRPDNMLVNVAIDDAYVLGTLSSRIHVVWALAQGGTLEDRPRYNKTRCFETFPFPSATDAQKARIRELGEALDAHRKRQQEQYPDLTMTGMYNVLEKLRSGEALTAKEKAIHEQGLVSVLKELHDELDAAVFDAYGWPRDLTDEQILERLVALNAERAAEERQGLIRWLRPEFQCAGGVAGTQTEAEEITELEPAAEGRSAASRAAVKREWPKTLAEQAQAVRAVLAAFNAPATAEDVARSFTRARNDRVSELLETLASLGQCRKDATGKYAT